MANNTVSKNDIVSANENNGENQENTGNVVSNSETTEVYGQENDEYTSTGDAAEDFEYTQEYLQQNTDIGKGWWLGLFCLAIGLGALVSALNPIMGFNIDNYNGSYILGMSDISFGVGLFVLAATSLVALHRRDTDAIFLAKAYLIICMVNNLFVFLIRDHVAQNLFTPLLLPSLIWSLIWLLYLYKSRQVEEVIPSEYRKTKKRDWYIIGSIVVVPLLFLVIGMYDVNRIAQKKTTEFISQIQLKPGEHTDGRVIFTTPEGFICRDTTINEQQKLFILNDYIGTTVNIATGYTNDQSNTHVNTYWQNWEDQVAKAYPSSVTLSKERYINGLRCIYKVKSYDINGKTAYWRFVMIFDSESAMECVISSYDTSSDGYLDDLVKSIKFVR